MTRGKGTELSTSGNGSLVFNVMLSEGFIFYSLSLKCLFFSCHDVVKFNQSDLSIQLTRDKGQTKPLRLTKYLLRRISYF